MADAWAAYAAGEGDEGVPNRRHEMVPLSRMDQTLLTLLDGTRDLPALVEAMVEATLAGRLTVKVEGVATNDVEVIREAMATAVPDRLDRFKRTSLLVG
jgi:methyltransferase-like protein